MSDQEYQLIVQRGPEPGKIYELSSVNITIGRDPIADITITDPEVSRQHVRLRQSLSGYTIQDLGSTNGTYIDGQRLGGEPVELKHGQVITMGAAVAIRFEALQGEVDETLDRPTILDFSPSETHASIESEPEISHEPLQPEEPSEPLDEDFEPLEKPDQEFQVDAPETSSGMFTDSDEEEALAEHTEDVTTQEPDEFEERSNRSESEGVEDFVQSTGDPVVIPHDGEPPLQGKDESQRRPWRMPAIIISALLLILCCCCSFVLFLYYYGGDWMLRQLGFLP